MRHALQRGNLINSPFMNQGCMKLFARHWERIFSSLLMSTAILRRRISYSSVSIHRPKRLDGARAEPLISNIGKRQRAKFWKTRQHQKSWWKRAHYLFEQQKRWSASLIPTVTDSISTYYPTLNFWRKVLPYAICRIPTGC